MAEQLTKTMAESLPSSASPQLKSATDAIALALHASMITTGFQLVGLDEDQKLGKASSKHP